eukprot:5212771-Amphidinium_carterae.1
MALERVLRNHNAQYPQYASRTFMNWCEQNNLMPILSKYLEADDKTVKQQYVTADNGVGHNHNQAMALHHWHRDNAMILTNQQMAIRVNRAGNGADLQWTSRVTIMHSSVTVTVENDGKWFTIFSTMSYGCNAILLNAILAQGPQCVAQVAHRYNAKVKVATMNQQLNPVSDYLDN